MPPTFTVVRAVESERDQRRAATSMHKARLDTGDRIALVGRNSPELIAVALGALRQGVVPVMVNPDLLPHERQVILDDCRPSLVLGDADVAAFVGADVAESTALGPVPLGRPMHYTSGTTGRPKGVSTGVLAESDGAALLAEEIEQWGFRSDDRHLVCSPLYHSAPLRFSMSTLMARR